MWVKLGNVSPKEGYRNTIDPDLYELADLKAMCAQMNLPTDGSKEQLAYILSDVVRYKKIEANSAVVTKFSFPENDIDDVYAVFRGVLDVYAKAHSYDPPSWVESDNDSMARMLANEYKCPMGRPLDEEYLENNII